MGIGITGLVQGAFGASDRDLYGTKPVVPKAIDYSQSIRDAIASNLANLPSLQQLGLGATDTFNAIQERALPGYAGLRDQATNVISSNLRGEFTSDMARRLDRDAAERGVSLGIAGSEASTYDALEKYGLTRLSLQNQGLQQANSWLALNRNNTFDISRFFEDKNDAIRRSEFNWNRDWLAANVASAPDPGTRGAWDTEMGFVGEILSVYGGGPGYQQTYRQNYGGGGSGGGGGGGGGSGGGGSFFGFGGGGGPQGYNSYRPNSGGDIPDDIGSGAEY